MLQSNKEIRLICLEKENEKEGRFMHLKLKMQQANYNGCI